MVTSNAATGYVAKISMLRLNIGSGMRRVAPPCLVRILGPRPMLSMHELSLSMPEPMLSPSMLILAKSRQSKSKSWLTKVSVRSKNHQI